jgi:hypothetical protein
MLKKTIIGLALVVGLLIVVALLSDRTPELEVRAFPNNSLVIKNVGTQPIKITDVLVNERLECSAISPIELTERFFIKKSYNVDERHKLWVSGFSYQQVGPLQNQISSINPPTEPDVGDSQRWQALCNIVRVTVTTDKGSETYSFTK